MTEVLILIVGLSVIAGYCWLASLIGRRAEAKGRSRESWTMIAFFFGLLIPAIAIACMKDTDGGEGAQVLPRLDVRGKPPASDKSSKLIGQLNVLAAARVHGHITTEEFEERKNKLLDTL